MAPKGSGAPAHCTAQLANLRWMSQGQPVGCGINLSPTCDHKYTGTGPQGLTAHFVAKACFGSSGQLMAPFLNHIMKCQFEKL
eukprot:scaffold63200_cov63-Phaeocystis_antarctica.AAC.1